MPRLVDNLQGQLVLLIIAALAVAQTISCRVALKSVLPHFVWRNYPEIGKFRRYSCEFEEALVARERCCRSKR